MLQVFLSLYVKKFDYVRFKVKSRIVYYVRVIHKQVV